MNHHHISPDSPEAFYDQFCRRFVNDYVVKNERIAAQKTFVANAVPRTTTSVLIVGAGSGETAYFLAEHAKQSKVLAVDLSSEALKLADRMFSHPHIEYRQANITEESVEGSWDLIFLPDVYEHIPLVSRPALHRAIDRLLSPVGMVLLTVPSPAKQAAVHANGTNQIIDETVTFDDLVNFATSVHGQLSYFNLVSIWESGDYIHAIIQRGTKIGPLNKRDLVPLRTHASLSFPAKVIDFTLNRSGVREAWRRFKRRRLEAKLFPD